MVDSEIVAGLRTCELFAALSEQEVEGLITLLAGSCQVANTKQVIPYSFKASLVRFCM